MTNEELEEIYISKMCNYKKQLKKYISTKKCKFTTTEQVSSFGPNSDFINLCDSARVMLWTPFVLSGCQNSEAKLDVYCNEIEKILQEIKEFDI